MLFHVIVMLLSLFISNLFFDLKNDKYCIYDSQVLRVPVRCPEIFFEVFNVSWGVSLVHAGLILTLMISSLFCETMTMAVVGLVPNIGTWSQVGVLRPWSNLE